MASTSLQLPENFDKISTEGQVTIATHLEYSRQLRELMNVREWLIDQIHSKKSIKRGSSFRPQPGRVSNLYHAALFLDTKGYGLYDWSTDFTSALDNLLFKSLSVKDRGMVDWCSVYYPRSYEHCIIKQDWVLSDGLHEWTVADEALIAAYVNQLYFFLKTKLELISCCRRCPLGCQKWFDKVKSTALLPLFFP